MRYVRVAVLNTALLLLVATPAALGTAFAEAWLLGQQSWRDSTGRSIGASLEAFAFWYASLLFPLLVGGALHQLVIWQLTTRWRSAPRAVAVLTSPVVLLGMLVYGSGAKDLLHVVMIIPIAVLLGTYGLFVRSISS